MTHPVHRVDNAVEGQAAALGGVRGAGSASLHQTTMGRLAGHGGVARRMDERGAGVARESTPLCCVVGRESVAGRCGGVGKGSVASLGVHRCGGVVKLNVT